MPKDRIAEFKRKQYALRPSSENVSFLDSRRDSHVIRMENLGDLPSPNPEEFNELEEMWLMHSELKQKVDQLSVEQEKILNTANPAESTQKELERLSGLIKKDSENFRTRLKLIESRITEDELNVKESDGSKPLTEIRMRRSQLGALTTLFVSTIEKYKKIQEDHRDRCKIRIKRQLEIAGTYADDEQVEEMIDQGNWKIFGQSILQQTEETRRVLADVQARHNDILKLEQSIREIHELFKEMAILVESQGQMINSVEKHVAETIEYVHRAVPQLGKAGRRQDRARRKKILLAIIVIMVIIVLGIIILSELLNR